MRGQADMAKHGADADNSSDLYSVVQYLQAVHDAKHKTDEQMVAAIIEKHELIRCQVSTTLMSSKEVGIILNVYIC